MYLHFSSARNGRRKLRHNGFTQVFPSSKANGKKTTPFRNVNTGNNLQMHWIKVILKEYRQRALIKVCVVSKLGRVSKELFVNGNWPPQTLNPLMSTVLVLHDYLEVLRRLAMYERFVFASLLKQPLKLFQHVHINSYIPLLLFFFCWYVRSFHRTLSVLMNFHPS